MNKLLMAFDFGERRTGVAISQSLTQTARPLTTVSNPLGKIDWPAVERLLKEWDPEEIIVGIPDDSEQNKALRKKIRKFCTELESRFQRPVHTHDETLTSDEAYFHLKKQRQQSKKQIDKKEIDKIAAAILLESWMSVNLSP
jgi:putative Holliday junction resolvase